MRKKLHLLLLLLLALPIGMLAQELRFVDQPDGTVKLSYRVKKDDWGNYVRVPNSYSGDIVIPSTHNGKTVTAIGDLAFDACVNLTSVSIPNTVKVIEENAFRGCESLVAVSIPGSVESIDAYAFTNTGLKKVTLEDGSKVLNTWRGGVYNGYTSFSDSPIETLYVGRNLVSGQNPFRGFTTIKYLTFGNQVTSVCAEEFKSCKGIRSIDFGQSITSIGNNAFYDCDELGTVTLPESVGIIGDAAFFDCEMLAKVNIPNKVRVIHASTFQYCKNLASIVIPATVDSIGAYAFNNTGMTKVTLEDGDRMLKTWRGGVYNGYTPFSGSPIEKLYVGRNLEEGKAPFQRFTTIKNLTLSDNVTSVLDDEFYECRGLRTVKFGKNIIDIGKNAFRECDTLLTVTLPESVKRIGDAAFFSCDTLSRVNIPSKVSLICGDAFNHCKNLTAITIPASVDSIGAYAFNNTGMTKVTLEDGDKVLKTWRGGTYNGYTPFSGSPIETLYVGRNFLKDTAPFQRFTTIKTLTMSDKVTSVLDNEFYECRGLRTVTFGKNITDIGKNAFRECDTLLTVTLPESVKRIGDAAFFSCDTLSRANIPSKVSLICGDAFNYCKNLAAITIPASVDSIGAYAFNNTGMTKVTLEDGDRMLKTWRGGTYNGYTPFSGSPIEKLYVGRNLEEGKAPFQRFTTIKTLTLSDKVTSVLDNEFYECRGLRTVKFGKNITDIGKNAFRECDTLLTVTLPESVTRIGDAAFFSCDTLSRVNIPSKVSEICGDAFNHCKNLTAITIPASVQSIGAYAFSDCGLKEVTIKNSSTPLKTWRGGTYNGSTSFSGNPIETLYVGRDFEKDMAPFRGFETITKLYVGKTVTHLYVNEYNNCKGLRQIYSYNTTPPVCDDSNVFQNVDKKACKLYVLEGRVAAYKAADVWKEFFDVDVTEDYEEKPDPQPGDDTPLPSDGTGTEYVYNPTDQTVTVTDIPDDEQGVIIACGPWDIPVKQVLIPYDIFHKNPPKDVSIGSTTPPTVIGGDFDPDDVGNITLHVPAGYEDEYKNHPEWGKFKEIIGDYDKPQPGPGDVIDEFTLWYTLDIGGTVGYKLSEKPQVRLLGEETTVTSSRGVATFETLNIWKFTLTAGNSDPVGIKETLAPVQPDQPNISRESGDALVFSGCRPGESVWVYTAGGRLVSQYRIDDNGSLTLSLSSWKQGLYIVKAGSANIKIMKK